MDNKQHAGAGVGVGGYPPNQGFAPTGFPETGFANAGYGAPPPAGFVYPGPSQQGPHMGYNMPDNEGPKGPYSNESGRSYGDLHGIDFSERSIRMAFIRKVYGILSVQLLLTTGLIAVFLLSEGAKGFVRQNWWFTLVSYVAAIAVLIALSCCENLRRKSPHNLLLLGAFTLTYGVVIGVIASRYRVEDVLTAAGITVAVCVGLTIFSFQTKWDFTMMGGILFVCLIVLFLFGILAIFLGDIFRLFLAAAGALLFSVYLVYDTQLMIGGNHKMSISPEEYIFAALNIYMDIIMIFLYLLRLFGSRD